MTDFTFKVALIFLPGIICYVLIEKLTFHHKHDTFQAVLYSFLFGLLCYGCYYKISTIYAALHNYEIKFAFTESLSDGSIKLIWDEIFNVSLLSVLFGIVISVVINKGYFYRFFRFIKVTRKGSSDDVWLAALNKGWGPYVEITDLKNDRTYVGWVEDYSELCEQKEVLLRDVFVEEQSTKKYLFMTPAIYLILSENCTMEFASAAYYEKPSIPERSDTRDESKQANTKSTAAATKTLLGADPRHAANPKRSKQSAPTRTKTSTN